MIIYNWICKKHRHVGFVILPHASFLTDADASHLHPEDNMLPVILASWKGKMLTHMAFLFSLPRGKQLLSFPPFWDQTLGLLRVQFGKIPHRKKTKPRHLRLSWLRNDQRPHRFSDNYSNCKVKPKCFLIPLYKCLRPNNSLTLRSELILRLFPVKLYNAISSKLAQCSKRYIKRFILLSIRFLMTTGTRLYSFKLKQQPPLIVLSVSF